MDVLTVKQTATFLGRTEGAVRKLCLRRTIPFRKPGGRLIFIQKEIEDWIEHSQGVRLTDLENE